MKPWNLARLGAGVAILALILLTTDLQGISDALSDADLTLILLVVALNLPLLILVTLRSRLVLLSLGHNLSLGTLFSTTTLGFVAGSFTPAATGELLRTDALGTTAGVTAHDGLALVTFERLLSFYLLILTGLAAGAVLVLPAALALAVVVVVIALIGLPAFSGPILARIPQPRSEPVTLPQRFLSLLRTMLTRMEMLVRDKRLVATWSLVTLLTFALISVQFWLIGESVNASLSYPESIFAYAGPQILGILSFIPLGLGVADGSTVGFLTERGIEENQALSIAVLIRAAITLPLIVAAVIAYIQLATKRRAPANDGEPARTSTEQT